MYDDIILFINIVKSGNFSTFAKNTGIAQSTISRKIKALEDSLGIKLVKRDTRNIQLTDKGQILFDNFKDCEKQWSSLIHRLYEENAAINGTLKILLPPAFAHHAITPHIGEFSRANPDLQLRLQYEYREINMVRENYDIAIITFPPKQSTQICKLIYRSKFVFACSPAYLERYGTPSSFSENDKHRFIGRIDEDSSYTKPIALFSETTDEVSYIPNNFKVHVNNYIEALQLIRQGHLIAGVAEDDIWDELNEGRLIRLFPEIYAGYLPIYLLRNIDSDDRRYVAFEQFISQCINRLKQHKNKGED